jgi:Glycosyl transferases group 1
MDHIGTVEPSSNKVQRTAWKCAAIFVAPLCNQLAAVVMHGLKELGYSLYANRGWCCGTYDRACWRVPVIPEWNWCQLVSDEQLLHLARDPDVLVIGTVRYESVRYWEEETDGMDVQKAAHVQLEAAERGLLDLYIDDGDYDVVYPQMARVPHYFKREPTLCRNVHLLHCALCPWLPIFPAISDRVPTFLISACFPFAVRQKWDRLQTLWTLRRAFKDSHDIWIGPVREPTQVPRFVATGKRQGEKYLEIIRQSSASLSLPGEGWDTFRFWEILSCGSCLFSPRRVLRELSIDPLPKDGEEYVGFDTDRELVDLICYYRSRRKELAIIAAKGQTWAMEHHKSSNRAEQILKTVCRAS